jgi:hypothetical protein
MLEARHHEYGPHGTTAGNEQIRCHAPPIPSADCQWGFQSGTDLACSTPNEPFEFHLCPRSKASMAFANPKPWVVGGRPAARHYPMIHLDET